MSFATEPEIIPEPPTNLDTLAGEILPANAGNTILVPTARSLSSTDLWIVNRLLIKKPAITEVWGKYPLWAPPPTTPDEAFLGHVGLPPLIIPDYTNGRTEILKEPICALPMLREALPPPIGEVILASNTDYNGVPHRYKSLSQDDDETYFVRFCRIIEDEARIIEDEAN